MATYEFSSFVFLVATVLIQKHFVFGNPTAGTGTTNIEDKVVDVVGGTTNLNTITTDHIKGSDEKIINLKFVCSFTFETYNETAKNGSQETIRPSIRLAPVCCPGFKRKDASCVPHCEGGCGDGVCKFPGVCTCEKKFEYCRFGNYSKPKPEALKTDSCMENCKYGTCLPNNTCQCIQGFKHVDDSTRRYVNSSVGCVPSCFPFCSNKPFTSPDQCTCSYSYTYDYDDDPDSKLIKQLQTIFEKYDHPNFGTGATSGSSAGYVLGSLGKAKSRQSNPQWLRVNGFENDVPGTNDNQRFQPVPSLITGNKHFGLNNSSVGSNGRSDAGWVNPGINHLGSNNSSLGTTGSRPPGWLIPSRSGIPSNNLRLSTSYRPEYPGWNLRGVRSSGGSSDFGGSWRNIGWRSRRTERGHSTGGSGSSGSGGIRRV